MKSVLFAIGIYSLFPLASTVSSCWHSVVRSQFLLTFRDVKSVPTDMYAVVVHVEVVSVEIAGQVGIMSLGVVSCCTSLPVWDATLLSYMSLCRVRWLALGQATLYHLYILVNSPETSSWYTLLQGRLLLGPYNSKLAVFCILHGLAIDGTRQNVIFSEFPHEQQLLGYNSNRA